MTDTLELELAITRAGITKRDISKILETSEACLYKKINNRSEFKASEIEKLKKVLSLSEKERNKIFFSSK